MNIFLWPRGTAKEKYSCMNLDFCPRGKAPTTEDCMNLCFLFLKTLRLNKLLPGVIFLCLLFFYDIFMVFFTPHFTSEGKSVMVKVALGIEAPIKLLMPHISIKDYPTNTCSMLGLGDIVVPGLFIGFLIRFGR